MEWDHPGVLLAIATALVTATAWMTGIYKNGKHTQRDLDEYKGTVSGFMAEIRDDIKKILHRLPAYPIGTTSPLSLTDYGEEIAAAVNALPWAREHVELVKGRAAGKPAYEIEEISFAYAREEHELSPSMREVMYEHGYSGEHVRSVLGLVLRDELIRLERGSGAVDQSTGVSAGPDR